MMHVPKGRPSAKSVLTLKCPYCQKTPMLAEKAWFSFREGCPNCHYRFEREAGYFTGASWMVAFPIGALSGLFIAAFLTYFRHFSGLEAASAAACALLFLSVAITPYSRAIWLIADHYIHPLTDEDFVDHFKGESRHE